MATKDTGTRNAWKHDGWSDGIVTPRFSRIFALKRDGSARVGEANRSRKQIETERLFAQSRGGEGAKDDRWYSVEAALAEERVSPA